jgi:hypothetical protein
MVMQQLHTPLFRVGYHIKKGGFTMKKWIICLALVFCLVAVSAQAQTFSATINNIGIKIVLTPDSDNSVTPGNAVLIFNNFQFGPYRYTIKTCSEHEFISISGLCFIDYDFMNNSAEVFLYSGMIFNETGVSPPVY